MYRFSGYLSVYLSVCLQQAKAAESLDSERSRHAEWPSKNARDPNAKKEEKPNKPEPILWGLFALNPPKKILLFELVAQFCVDSIFVGNVFSGTTDMVELNYRKSQKNNEIRLGPRKAKLLI